MTDYRPELLATAGSEEQALALLEAGADAVEIGEHRYGLRLSGEIARERLKTAVARIHERGGKAYVAVNQVLDNAALDALPGYLGDVAAAGADAIVFGDPAVFATARSHAPQVKLHWNAEMTSTNYGTANYWADKGAARVELARELNLEEVVEFKEHARLQVQVQVHGMTNMYHSKRELMQSYADYLGKNAGSLERGEDKTHYLTEQERPGLRFPIFEDRSGTHIMSPDDICMLDSMDELLQARIDSFKIEGLLKSPAYQAAAVRAYRTAIDAYLADPEHYVFREEWLDPIRELQDPNRELTYGFFYKVQVY